MKKAARLTLFIVSLLVMSLGMTAATQVTAQTEKVDPRIERATKAVLEGTFSKCTPDRPHNNSDAIYRICRPPWWWGNNGDLVIWAHGYVDFTRPVGIPEDQLCLNDSLCIPDIVNFLGFNFATTSYSVNGLAVLPGLADVVELVDLYTARYGAPGNVYIVGASEGGLITTLAVEQYPHVFDAGLATCGPIGDFPGQINYFGDFRAVFDYYFPGLIPGDPTNIPPELIANWDTYYNETVWPVVSHPSNQAVVDQIVNVTDIPYDPNNPGPTVANSIAEVLWYNVFATNNATEVLGGQPFDNTTRVYSGSNDDAALNAGIQRIAADPAALNEMEANYQTTGVLDSPLVTLHTTLDQQVPYWHEVLYLQKTQASGSWPGQHINYPPTQVYGHCQFALLDVLGAFSLMLLMSSGDSLNQQHMDALLTGLSAETEVVQLHRIGEPYKK